MTRTGFVEETGTANRYLSYQRLGEYVLNLDLHVIQLGFEVHPQLTFCLGRQRLPWQAVSAQRLIFVHLELLPPQSFGQRPVQRRPWLRAFLGFELEKLVQLLSLFL